MRKGEIMKQKYVKPTMIVERFTLTQSIAHNCAPGLDFGNANLKYKGQCGWFDGETFLWGSVASKCDEYYDGFDGVVVCYNNPDGDLAIFNS